MNTVFLGSEEVTGYLSDFASRLLALGKLFPLVWCPIGRSGEELLPNLLSSIPQWLLKKITVVNLHFDRNKKTVIFENKSEAKALLAKTKGALVIDSSVHSGKAMDMTVAAVQKLGVRDVCSYSLVLKQGSSFIPNYFGILIKDHDRAYFLLDKIPSNRLMPFGTIRKVSQKDVRRSQKTINCGLPSIDRMTWADMFYDSKSHGSQVFVFEERNSIRAFISFEIKDGDCLTVDAVAASRTQQGRGLGGHLMRWAETYARSTHCHSMVLWAIKDRIGYYEKVGFVNSGDPLDLGDEIYYPMKRTLLYNLCPKDNV